MTTKADATRVRLTEDERAALERLARLNERSLSAEIRRALRFYFEHFDTVDRALREKLRAGVSA
jgi:hypothetical protein